MKRHTWNTLWAKHIVAIALAFAGAAMSPQKSMAEDIGHVYGTGYNGYGELGLGDNTNYSTPQKVVAQNGFISVSMGGHHTLALKDDGTVWAWGWNQYGQLGDSSQIDRSTPVKVVSLTNCIAVAAGYAHSLALMDDGTVWAWGWNSNGQLGNNTTTDSNIPIMVNNYSNVAKICAGREFSIALSRNGNVFAWGDNSSGQLGCRKRHTYKLFGSKNENWTWGAAEEKCESIGGHLASISSDDEQSIVYATLNHQGKCWLGAIGNWNTSTGVCSWRWAPNLPVAGAGLSYEKWGLNEPIWWYTGSVIAIAAVAMHADGVWHTCKPGETLPFFVCEFDNGGDVIDIAAGEKHSLILTKDGRVYASGENSSGQLGLGDLEKRSTATEITSVTSIVGIKAGDSHSFALRADGSVYAFGYNFYGQLGDGTNTNKKSPVQITALSNVQSIFPGADHSFAILADGTVHGWGKNNFGQLGNGNTDNQNTPQQIANFTGINAISGGLMSSSAIESQDVQLTMAVSSTETGTTTPLLGTHTVKAGTPYIITATPVTDFNFLYWSIQGNATITNVNSTVSIVTLLGDATITAVFNGQILTMERSPMSGGEIVPTSGKHMVPDNKDVLIQAIPATNYTFSRWVINGSVTIADTSAATTTVSLSGAGTVTAQFAQYIPPEITMDVMPVGSGTVDPEIGTHVVDVDVPYTLSAKSDTGYHFVCWSVDGGAVLEDILAASTTALITGNATITACFALDRAPNPVISWGNNEAGQLGDGTKHERHAPIQVNLISDAIQVESGCGSSYALLRDGTVWSWGNNQYGQLGDGTMVDKDNPVSVPNLSNVKCISVGNYHVLALTNDGKVFAWGKNANGQVGNNSTTNSLTPVQTIKNVKYIACGAAHSLAVLDDGRVYVWGKNDKGQLGDGTIADAKIPLLVNVLSNIITVKGGSAHSLALQEDGYVWAWGDNTYGQLGNGSTTMSLIPVKVAINVVNIACGSDFSMTQKDDKTVWSWGNNASGQLGDGSTIMRTSPVLIMPEADAVTDIVASCSGTHAFYKRADGSVYAWGQNTNGQLADGDTSNVILPKEITALKGVLDICCGGNHSLAIANKPLELTLAVASNGMTDPAPGSHVVTKNVAIAISAIPDTHYVFDKWTASVSAIVADEYSDSTTVTISSSGDRHGKFQAEPEPSAPDGRNLTC